MKDKSKMGSRSSAKDPRYHDTWRLLKKFRDVVWSMELSVHQLQNQFEIEYESSIDEFLESVYIAGADLSGTDIEQRARSIDRSNKMISLVRESAEILRKHHKDGELYYWILYYTYLSPQKLQNAEEIVEVLRPHGQNLSVRTYYNRLRKATDALSSILWGYTSKDSIRILDEFFPE